MKRVLVACEFSGTVREAFRKRGFDAVSIDIIPSDDQSPYHYQMDVLKYLETVHAPIDLMIAHPPCTYLCNSGVCWLHPAKGATRTKKNYTDQQCVDRWAELAKSIDFFNSLQAANIKHIAIENPIPHKYAKRGWQTTTGAYSSGIGKYTQIIQPYQFGHAETKATCLWLKNLPKLTPTKMVLLPVDRAKRMRLHYLSPGPDRWKIRSKTYQGIADAMAEQWGDYINGAT